MRVVYAMDRLTARARSRSAFRVSMADAVAGDFASLRGRKHGLLVTFRRDGQAVPTPIWMAVDDQGRVVIQTGLESWKLKRIAHNPTVLIAASTARGRPRGPILLGSARVLSGEDAYRAEQALASAFGLERRLYLKTFGIRSELVAYIEITAGAPATPSG